MNPSAPMPQYECHKKVWALKINEVICHADADPSISIEEFAKTDKFQGCHLMVENPFSPIPVDAEWYRKNKPQAGGYYVVYKDGYTSYSPADAFEEGYTLIK